MSGCKGGPAYKEILPARSYTKRCGAFERVKRMERLEKIPVPAVATMLSFLTLGNVYGGLGFVWLRWLIMAIGTVFIICYILKIALYSGTCIKEYDQTIPSSGQFLL